MPALSPLDLWRLTDRISVINAAILIAGGDPSEHFMHDDGNRIKKTWQHDGFEPAFDALRGSIMANKLNANLVHALRSNFDGISNEIEFGPKEDKVSFDMLIARNETLGNTTTQYHGTTKLNFSVDDVSGQAHLFIWKEPNWENSTVVSNDIKLWLSKRGLYPDFFFPSGNKGSFLNSENPRYSAKLACAVAAWEAIEKPATGKSVKKTVQDWVQSNGVEYGLGEDGIVSPTAAEEIAKITNWNPKGGANRTPEAGGEGQEKPTSKPQNYGYAYED